MQQVPTVTVTVTVTVMLLYKKIIPYSRKFVYVSKKVIDFFKVTNY